MWKRLKQYALAVVAGAAVLALLSSSPANATGLAATRTVFYAGVVAGEYLPWASDNQVTGRNNAPMEGLWIMPWGGGEICATASIPGRGWQDWQCAQPGVSFLVGTVGQGLTMNGLSVRTQFGRICLQVATRDPSQPWVRFWWGPKCSNSGIGMPAGNHWIELVAIYYES
ncbi:MAG TPA: hypothetical protein VFR67_06500 [Pilimelia sp.]|nr:hypothetical protein [Pilimelia sp.]